MQDNKIIAADDAYTDSRTQEFELAYLRPHGITSMLDIPIHSEGKLIGVLCLEHIGEMRRWQLEEQHFAALSSPFGCTGEGSE